MKAKNLAEIGNDLDKRTSDGLFVLSSRTSATAAAHNGRVVQTKNIENVVNVLANFEEKEGCREEGDKRRENKPFLALLFTMYAFPLLTSSARVWIAFGVLKFSASACGEREKRGEREIQRDEEEVNRKRKGRVRPYLMNSIFCLQEQFVQISILLVPILLFLDVVFSVL